MKKQASVVSFLVLGGAALVVGLTGTIIVVVSTLLGGAITRTVTPFLAITSEVAGKAAAPGLQLESQPEVVASMQPFVDNQLLTYVQVKNGSGADVFVYRRKGLAPLRVSGGADGEMDGELLHTTAINVDGRQVGTLVIAMSLAERNAALASARRALIGIGVAAAVLTALAMRFLLRRKLESPLQTTAAEIRQSAGQVLQLSRMVAASGQSLSQGATEQAASLEETSASMEEMASMTRKNAENAAQATALVHDVAQHVTVSNSALTAMVASMTSIKESSNKVARIIKTIDEIAFQTNILALNAAVEAARAGESGMGFAVVADEVRSLAQRSAQAARDTATLIEESIARSQEGEGRVEQVALAIGAITDSVGQVRTIVEEVRAASEQQAQGIDQVSQSIAQMEKVTQTTAATAEETAAASEELNAQAESSIAVVAKLDGWRTGATAQKPGADAWAGDGAGNVVQPKARALRSARGRVAAQTASIVRMPRPLARPPEECHSTDEVPATF